MPVSGIQSGERMEWLIRRQQGGGRRRVMEVSAATSSRSFITWEAAGIKAAVRDFDLEWELQHTYTHRHTPLHNTHSHTIPQLVYYIWYTHTHAHAHTEAVPAGRCCSTSLTWHHMNNLCAVVQAGGETETQGWKIPRFPNTSHVMLMVPWKESRPDISPAGWDELKNLKHREKKCSHLNQLLEKKKTKAAEGRASELSLLGCLFLIGYTRFRKKQS